jgi:hypothetical protein
MNKHNFEILVKQYSSSMTLSHHKELLPIIFETHGLKDYYDAFTRTYDGLFNSDGKEELCYHNKTHAAAVTLNCYEAVYSTELPISVDDKKSILLAAIFHDTDHSRGAWLDVLNIANAINALKQAHKEATYKVTVPILNKAVKLIGYTQYPYVVASDRIKDYCARVIRDADLMMLYEPSEVAVDLHVGLFNEMKDGGYGQEGPVSPDTFIEKYSNFVYNIRWNTRWARNKAFMHNYPQLIKQMKVKLTERLIQPV